MFTQSEVKNLFSYRDVLKLCPVIKTVEELKSIPDKSIVWYPAHSDDFGGCLTGRALKQHINDHYGHCHPDVVSPQLIKIIKEDVAELGTNCPTLQFIECEFSLPLMEVCDDVIEYDDADDLVFDSNSVQQLIAFIKTAVDKGYKFYWVPYEGGNQNDIEAIRSYWIFD